MAFFGVNPFSTHIGQKIEEATSETLPSEDWSLNIEICDLINQAEEGPKDAMKALRKRISSQPKNYSVVLYTLTVLETCVKNCGKRFHILVCTKEFIQELVKLIGPKNDPPSAVQEKVLSLIQSWADVFRHQPELSGVSQVYADLKHKGIEFPPVDSEMTAPILTPSRSVDVQSIPSTPQVNSEIHSQHPNSSAFVADVPRVPASLTASQAARLHSELDLVESNAKVLSEMLNELTPGQEHKDDIQLLKDLHATCKVMQERVVELVGKISDDHLTADLLRINDDLNNLFIRYDRHATKTKALSSSTEIQKEEEEQKRPLNRPQTKKETEDAPLIDLGDEAAAPSQQMVALNLGKNEENEFDVFAQSRTAVDGAKASDENVADTSLNENRKQSDFDEMEKWLSEEHPIQEQAASAAAEDRLPEETISSSEFDRFLEERASAAEVLPTVAATGSPNADPQTNNLRSIAKEEKGGGGGGDVGFTL